MVRHYEVHRGVQNIAYCISQLVYHLNGPTSQNLLLVGVLIRSLQHTPSAIIHCNFPLLPCSNLSTSANQLRGLFFLPYYFVENDCTPLLLSPLFLGLLVVLNWSFGDFQILRWREEHGGLSYVPSPHQAQVRAST